MKIANHYKLLCDTMSEKSIITYEPKALRKELETFSEKLTIFLEEYNLPSEDILVPLRERGKVVNNIPDILENLDPEQAKIAYYISKFIAACVSGLFDAALNYLWNETILSLKEKIKQFDLNYFFDIVITNPTKRKAYKTEADLDQIQDWELVQGCYKIGIISQTGYKHLDYIRDMRNFASAAHPNHIELTGLQLASWLETCIKEVLSKGPSDPAIKVKSLLINIRNQSISNRDLPPIIDGIQNLPKIFVNSLARAIFGIYTDPEVEQRIKTNIDLIAKAVWDETDSEVKYEIGYKFGVFSVNADIERKGLAKDFLNTVEGLSFIPDEQLSIEIREKCEELSRAHYNYNNFYNETPHAQILKSYIPPTGKIPDSVRFEYVKTLIICRLGNRYGVAWTAVPIYDKLISLFREVEILCFIRLLNDDTFKNQFVPNKMGSIYRGIAQKLKEKSKNKLVQTALGHIVNTPDTQIMSQTFWDEIHRLLYIHFLKNSLL